MSKKVVKEAKVALKKKVAKKEGNGIAEVRSSILLRSTGHHDLQPTETGGIRLFRFAVVCPLPRRCVLPRPRIAVRGIRGPHLIDSV